MGARIGRHGLFGGVRGEHREGLAGLRDRLALGRLRLLRRDETARRDAVEHARARDASRLGKALRPARLRRLRQRHQQRRLADRQLARLLAEIGERGGAHAFEIAAERRQHQIAIDDAALGEPPLHLPGARHLTQLGGQRALVARLDQPRHLHRQGRAAGDDVAARDPLAGGARHRAPVDAAMRVEAPVLVGEQHREIARIDLAAGHRKAPAPVGQGEGAQQPPVAIDDDRRAEAGGGEIERLEAGDVAVPRRRPAKAEHEDERADGGEDAAFEGVRHSPSPPTLSRTRERGIVPSPACGRQANLRFAERWREAPDEGLPASHFAVTSIEPNAVRPKRSGRYMSSAVAGG